MWGGGSDGRYRAIPIYRRLRSDPIYRIGGTGTFYFSFLYRIGNPVLFSLEVPIPIPKISRNVPVLSVPISDIRYPQTDT